MGGARPASWPFSQLSESVARLTRKEEVTARLRSSGQRLATDKRKEHNGSINV